MIYSNTSGLKAIFDYINGSKFLWFLILLVFIFCWNLFLRIKQEVPSAKSANIKSPQNKSATRYCKPAVCSLQISMWLVRCKLCRVYNQALTPARGWAQEPVIFHWRHYSDIHYMSCIVPKDLHKQFFVLKKSENKDSGLQFAPGQ